MPYGVLDISLFHWQVTHLAIAFHIGERKHCGHSIMGSLCQLSGGPSGRLADSHRVKYPIHLIVDIRQHTC